MSFNQIIPYQLLEKSRCKSEGWNLTLALSEEVEDFEAGSAGVWCWVCPCSPSTIIWHMQCFALLQALRHWSKEWALIGPGNKNRNKGTNDFVPTSVWCLPLAHWSLSAYWLFTATSSSHFLWDFILPTLTINLSIMCLTTQIISSKEMPLNVAFNGIFYRMWFGMQFRNWPVQNSARYFWLISGVFDVRLHTEPIKI